jgi:hypothetical protein
MRAKRQGRESHESREHRERRERTRDRLPVRLNHGGQLRHTRLPSPAPVLGAMRQGAEALAANKAVDWDLAMMEIDEKYAHERSEP